jgi:DNA helicase HerA-like ATPase
MAIESTPSIAQSLEFDHEPLGRVTAVSGSQLTVALSPASPVRATVGKFLSVVSGRSIIVGMITQVAEQPIAKRNQPPLAVAQMDLFGEITIQAGGTRFRRGIGEYPIIGEPVALMTARELRLLYSGLSTKLATIGFLQQDAGIPAQIEIDQLVGKHFAVVGTTGVGKSTGLAIILQEILAEWPDLRIFLVDPHDEYTRCFGDKAEVLNARVLRLPFWLFNFEETIEAFFGGRSATDEEVEILSETIPLAKAAYSQLGANGVALMKKELRAIGYSVDTPVPYRIEDLIGELNERMGKLENSSSQMTYHKLIRRIQICRNNPSYSFMFDNATVGGDTMAEVVSDLFRYSAAGKPLAIMQLAGLPAEVIDSVVSVVARMAFDFGMWSDGASPLLFVCEEAHRYAPANAKIGFEPTRRALSRIAKEGRKYGTFLGLVTQRPAEIDTTIISQCGTMFVMRLSNDCDQALIRAAVPDAGAGLLSCVPSLGTGEVLAFGCGVPLPMRMKFRDVPEALRPTSDAGIRRPSAVPADHGKIYSVIERWRASTMGHGAGFDGKHVELRHAHSDIPPTSAYGQGSSQNLSDGSRAERAADIQPNVAEPLERAAFGRRKT